MRMKVLKGIIASFLIVLPMNANVYANGDINVTQVSFIDVDNGYWANGAITDLAKNNVISGYEDHSFKPENHVTREEFASLIAKTFYLDLPAGGAKQTFMMFRLIVGLSHMLKHRESF